jgi:hypothetical protein
MILLFQVRIVLTSYCVPLPDIRNCYVDQPSIEAASFFGLVGFLALARGCALVTNRALGLTKNPQRGQGTLL